MTDAYALDKSKIWASRIVGYGEIDPEQLLPNEMNYRLHPKRQQDALSGSLNELGWVDDVKVNKRTSELWGPNDRFVETLLDGHSRAKLALRKGEKSIPVKYLDLTPQEEALFLAVFDPITYMAETDSALLDALLREVNTGESTLQELLEDMAVDAGIVPPDDPNEHWRGMPEFKQEDQTSYQSIHVHFKSAEDRNDFAELVGQKLTEKTRSIWYPEAEIERYADKRYIDES